MILAPWWYIFIRKPVTCTCVGATDITGIQQNEYWSRYYILNTSSNNLHWDVSQQIKTYDNIYRHFYLTIIQVKRDRTSWFVHKKQSTGLMSKGVFICQVKLFRFSFYCWFGLSCLCDTELLKQLTTRRDISPLWASFLNTVNSLI